MRGYEGANKRTERILDQGCNSRPFVPAMRVRITKPLSGSIDGIQLSRFLTGLTYDVGTTLANYLLSMQVAVPVDSVTPALVVPLSEIKRVLLAHPPMAEAADRPRAKTARKKH